MVVSTDEKFADTYRMLIVLGPPQCGKTRRKYPAGRRYGPIAIDVIMPRTVSGYGCDLEREQLRRPGQSYVLWRVQSSFVEYTDNEMCGDYNPLQLCEPLIFKKI